jgi:hypothetical protein
MAGSGDRGGNPTRPPGIAVRIGIGGRAGGAPTDADAAWSRRSCGGRAGGKPAWDGLLTRAMGPTPKVGRPAEPAG